MTTEEQIKVMQAFVSGKYIQWKRKGDKIWCTNQSFNNTKYTLWNWQDFDYRIQLTQRTHKEIMSNWFYRKNLWCKVKAYNAIDKQYMLTFDGWRDKEYFNDLEMKTDEQMLEMEEE